MEEDNATLSTNDLQCYINIQIYMNIYEKFFNIINNCKNFFLPVKISFNTVINVLNRRDVMCVESAF